MVVAHGLRNRTSAECTHGCVVIAKILGIVGMVITRLLGVLLAALAAQFVIDGLRESFL